MAGTAHCPTRTLALTTLLLAAGAVAAAAQQAGQVDRPLQGNRPSLAAVHVDARDSHHFSKRLEPVSRDGNSFLETAFPAVGGSAVGFVAAAAPLGYLSNQHGSDLDGFILIAGLGGIAGSTLLSAMGAYHLGSPGERSSFGRAMGGATVGIGPGLVGMSVGSRYGVVGALAGYALAQGITTAFFAVR